MKGIYFYDGLGANGAPAGYSVKESRGIVKGLGGWKIDMPSGYQQYKTVTVIYKLRGGQEAQEWFRKRQMAHLQSTLGIKLNPSYSDDLRSQPVLTLSGFAEIPSKQMEWLAESSRLKRHNYREYRSEFMSPPVCGTRPNPVVTITESDDNSQTESESRILCDYITLPIDFLPGHSDSEVERFLHDSVDLLPKI